MNPLDDGRMSLSTFIDELRIAYRERLTAKTGWGKNELEQLFEASVVDALVGKRHLNIVEESK